MKNKFVQFAMALMLATGLSFMGCEVDPCKDVTCNEANGGGSCLDGDCVCEPGFEGEDCTTLSADKFVGGYNMEDGCDVGTSTYFVEIEKSAVDPAKIFLVNFGEPFCPLGDVRVEATINQDEFTLVSGPYCPDGFPGTSDFAGYYFTGEGTMLDSVTISANYTLNYTFGGVEESVTCTATLTRQ